MGEIPDYTTSHEFDTTDGQQSTQVQQANPVNNIPQAPTVSESQSSPVSATPSTGSMPAPSSRAPGASGAGRKSRKNATLSVEEQARITAEEDKRRRNTAASARFRVKKKMREQTLEKTVKDTMDKNGVLESRVSQLELENRWLKNLITEKNGGVSADGNRQSEAEVADMFKKYLASQKAEGQQKFTDSKISAGAV